MTVAADPNVLHGFSKPQVEKAASALLAHLRKNSKGKGGGGGGKGNDLFEDDDELLYMVRSFLWRSFLFVFSVERNMVVMKALSCALEEMRNGERNRRARRKRLHQMPERRRLVFFASTAAAAAALPSNALVSLFSRARTHTLSLSLSVSFSFHKPSQIVSLKKVPQERRNDKPVRMYVEREFFVFFPFRFPMPPPRTARPQLTSSSSTPLTQNQKTEPSRTLSTASTAPRSA